MVGNFSRINPFISGVNLKRKQALLESNLPAIRLMQNNSKIAAILGCYFFVLLDCFMAKKNSDVGLIPEVDIPFNKVDPVIFC